MGQKVSPHGLRVGINKDWSSYWSAKKKDFSKYLIEDNKLRKFIFDKYVSSAVSKVTIERTVNRLIIDIYTAKPGVLIGNKGAGIETLKQELLKLTESKNLSVNVKEVKKPDLDAMLVAQSVAMQLEKRITFRRAMKQAMQRVMKSGAQGCKIMVSGRLDGAEIARSEYYLEGRLPLHTLRSDVDYAIYVAKTTYGVLGVKVWIYKGEILGKKPLAQPVEELQEKSSQGGNE